VKIQRSDPDAKLYIVGQFSPELQKANFDFFMGENYEYLGVLNPPQMSALYKKCDFLLFTYFNDACSNTLIEALVSGVDVYDEYLMSTTGGTPELIVKFQERGWPYFALKRMASNYKKALNVILQDTT